MSCKNGMKIIQQQSNWMTRLFLGTFAMTFLLGTTSAEQPDFSAVEPLLKKHCYKCHGETKQEADFRLDKLNHDVATGENLDYWHEVLNRIDGGDMPPDEEPPLTQAEIERITSWLRPALLKATESSDAGRPLLRRMTRDEYNYTLQDLLGVPINFANELPPDGTTAAGFSNTGEVLGFSPLHMEYYLKIARHAMQKTIVTDGPPPVYRQRFWIGERKKNEFALLSEALPPTFEAAPNALAEVENEDGTRLAHGGIRSKPTNHGDGWTDLYPCQRCPVSKGVKSQRGPQPMLQVRMRHYPRGGIVRVRVKAASLAPKHGPQPHLAVCLARKAGNGIEFRQLGPTVVVEAREGQPQTYEFIGQLENLPIAPDDADVTAGGDNNETILGVWNAYDRDLLEKDKTPQPHLRVYSIEFEAPWLEQWPPEAHTLVLGESIQARRASEWVDSDGTHSGQTHSLARRARISPVEEEQARLAITRFLRRAWRRPPTDAEVARLHAYWQRIRADSDSYAASLRETLAIALVSPNFLMLSQAAEGTTAGQPLDDYELASRLSYFLWNSMPDEELFVLAESSEIREPATLRAQVKRMLADAKSQRMVKSFTHQWLDLARLDRVRVEATGGFHVGTKEELRRETKLFLDHVLRKELSALMLIDSDFMLLNRKLALLYGIEGIEHPDLRPVAIHPDDRRGGLLTQGSILTAGSDGRESHPVKRGAWLLKQLLDDPPPPPPPVVPQLDEQDRDTRKLSLKKRLEIHRDSAACNSCHRKIDPWGVALEGYDAVGRWRDERERQKRKINDTVALPGREEVAGIDGLQEYLLEEGRDKFARALVRKWLTYALGRPLTLADDELIDDLTKEFEQDGYRLQPLIQRIVISDAFTRRS